VPRYFNGIVRAAVAAAAASRHGRPFSVLEIGAGSGGTTAAVLPALAADGTAYTFTDVSDFFLVRAAERFAEHPFVRYARLDIEEPPTAQGYEPGRADVVVAANVLHATRDLDTTLAHVRGLLAPGGLLVAFESTEHPRWFDITTGLIEGWQRFDDPWRTDVPLIDVGRWRAALEAAGFGAVEALPGDGLATSALLQHVILARAPGDEVTAPVGRSERPVGGTVDVASTVAPLDLDVRAQLDEAMEDEREGILVHAVRQAIAHVLRIDPDRLPRDQPLLDLGFDSLMALELRNVLRRSLGLEQKLPATLIFDRPTIAAIAAYLETLLTGAADGDVPVPEATAPGGDGAPRLAASAVAELSDDEVEALLIARLSEMEP
jgi:SAM-dependent methyltransferase/acyl carrier protein